jgi:prepilin-type N-terminal cleavage/methylation domain-containing protein
MRTYQRGMTLVEVLVAMAMVGVLIFATVSVTSSAMKGTQNNQDKQFATQKAISMLEELKSLVQVNSGSTINVLDAYDDGSAYYNRLTIVGDKLNDDPAAAASGNSAMPPSGWLYSRQISVQPLTDPNNPTIVLGSSDVRLVRVRVYRNESGGHRLLAEVASVVRTLAISFPPSQVYDVYCVAAENVPGWWVNMGSLIPYVQNAVTDLQNRHPGLVFRQHWITHLAYGRDPQYIPYVNRTNTSPTPSPISSVYFYPGQLPTSYTPEAGGSAVTPPAQYYYPPDNFDATIRTENGVEHGLDSDNTSNTYNPYPYALADQYNHAMRYYDEFALYNRRVAATKSDGTPAYPGEEMTLRLLLDDMNMNPSNYTNAIIINLHGELLPFPPTRNYSDAAKKPDYYRGDNSTTPEKKNGVRVVLHPEQLAYHDTDDDELRVYSYMTNPDNSIYTYPGGTRKCLDGTTSPPCATFTGKEYLREPITIVLKGVDWTPLQGPSTTSFINAISGGVDFDNDGVRDNYSQITAPGTDGTSPAHRMYYTRASVVNGSSTDTVIKLYNSPLLSPCAGTVTPSSGVDCPGGGLPAVRRLYGLDYVPSPLEDFATGSAVTPFQTANNLTASGDREKNTARWILHIPASAFTDDQAWTVESRIGNYDASAGTFSPAYTEPTDLSRTYFWRGSDNWLYGTSTISPALPMSERFQFLGDPRHCPYADLKMTHSTNSGTFTANTHLGMGYNRFFDDFENADGNKAAAEYTGTMPENYTVTTSNNKCYVKINGGSTITVTLTTGTRNSTNIVSDFNANTTFASAGTAADSPDGTRIRVVSDTGGPTSSVQFTTGSNQCNALLGFDTSIHYAMWPGWLYKIGSTQYGIKNDQTVGNGGWTTSNGNIEYDVQRAFQTWRVTMMATNALFTTMSGWPYYYMAIGNEIGYDAAQNFPDNVPVPRRPFDGLDTAQYFEQSITPGKAFGDDGVSASPATNARCGVKLIREADSTVTKQFDATTTDAWWSITWLGELYPDRDYNKSSGTDWKDFGNLPTTNGTNATLADTYRRIRRDSIPSNSTGAASHTLGTTFLEGSRRTHVQGMPSFFWTSGTTGVEADSGGTIGNLATAGNYINSNYNYVLPTGANMPATRPFNTGVNLPTIDGYGQTPYGNGTTVSALADFYDSDESGEYASALLAAREGTTSKAMYIVENGLSPSGTAGTDFIARYSFLTLIQGYFEAGLFNGGSSPAAAQVPRVIITAPNANTDLTDATSITISWSKTWTRWDGKKYASGYASNYSSSAAVSYLVMYSTDNGQTWKFVKDNAAATPGKRLASTDGQWITSTSYTWSTPKATFPAGAYTIRVEAYRNAYPLHYSFHMYQAFINRSS